MGQSKSKTYTVSDMARICGVSVASISKFVKRNGLKPVKVGKNNAKYFDDAVLSKIKSYYQSKDEKQSEASSNYKPATKDDVITELRARIDELMATNELLRDELRVKNKQIDNAIRIADQAQQLDLTTHQQQSLPEPVKTTEEKPEKKESWWKRLLGVDGDGK